MQQTGVRFETLIIIGGIKNDLKKAPIVAEDYQFLDQFRSVLTACVKLFL